ncbi:MAG: DUF2127 domain-containing protein [Candidatus Sulfotelmatobacter sp.]
MPNSARVTNRTAELRRADDRDTLKTVCCSMLSPSKIDLHRAQKSLLRAVATFEFIKGIFVLLVGILAVVLLHKDAWVMAESLLALLHISTDRRSAQLFLDFADDLTDARLWTAVKLAFVYSALRFAEGYGLWNGRTWAEWLAFGSGTLLLPLEIRALLRGITVLRSVVFAVNIGIILYMFFLLRAGRQLHRQLQSPQAESHDRSGI